MKRYDAMFILNDRKFEDGGAAYTVKIEQAIAECGGQDVETKLLGRKQFARPIGKKSSGVYVRFFFTMPEDQVKGFIERFRLEETVLRHVVYIYDIPAEPVTLKFET